MDRFVQSVRYGFVRSRQLEGTFPGDGQRGVWPITSLRVGYGWGAVSEEMWPYGRNWPPVEPPGLDVAAKKHRYGHYQRVRATLFAAKLRFVGMGIALVTRVIWRRSYNAYVQGVQVVRL